MDTTSDHVSTASDSKRTKLSNPSDGESILDKAKHNLYPDTTQLFSDLESASSKALDALQKVQSLEGNFLRKYTPELVEADRRSAEIEVFRRMAANLRAQEKAVQHSRPAEDTSASPSNSIKRMVNGDTGSEGDELRVNVSEICGKKVLTLYGNAQGHKQLFSSSQQALQQNEQVDEQNAASDARPLVEVSMPLREDKLPQQIYSSQIVSTDTQDALPKARQRLHFGELFKPPSSLKTLTPPKHPKHTTSRAAEISWTMEDSGSRAAKSGYAYEKLPTGAWLGYNSVSLPQEPISPEAKRKRRDRALSSGEPAVDQSLSLKVAQAQAKEDALFRGAYSSFAPCIDDSGALVPEEIRSEVWWHRYGDNSLYPADESDPELEPAEPTPEDVPLPATDMEEESFRKVVENYDPALLETEITRGHDPTEDDVDHLLQRISQLLESLLSFQRLRNATLRSSIGQSASTQDSPAVPTANEVKLYETSRTRLADLITKLPPYATAKLGGQQLSDLLVSRQILVDGRNYQGVMEEDQASRKAAAEALSNALGAANTRPTSGARASNTVNSRKPAPAYNTSRPTPSNSRQPLSSWQTPAQSGASSNHRPTYGQTPGYNRSLASGYRPGGTSGTPTNYSQTPSQPQYQQKAQVYNSGPSYGAGYGATHQYGRNNATPLQAGPQYQPNMQRPSSGGYYNGQSAPAPQATMQSPRAPVRPPNGHSAHSPMGAGSPYAPPPPPSSSTRPITPSTPAHAAMSRPGSGAGSPSKPLEKPLVNGA